VKVHPPKSERRVRTRLVLPVPEPVAESKHDLPATPTTTVAESRASASHVEIALAAYFIAEKRGFAPGRELDDWLAAEAEVAKAEELPVVKPVQLVGAGRLS
jgi:Protein of unknown function (DUF2934)